MTGLVRMAADWLWSLAETVCLDPNAAQRFGSHQLPWIRGRPTGNDCVIQSMRILLAKHAGGRVPSHVSLKQRALGYRQAWTWTHQAVALLDELGLDANYYTIMDSDRIRGESGPEEVYGGKGTRRIAAETLESPLRRGLVIFRRLVFEEIELEFRAGRDIAVVIDANTLLGMPGFRGHMVVLYDIHDDCVTYSGYRRPVEIAERQAFVRAWEAPGTDRDVLIVRGGRISQTSQVDCLAK